MATPAIQEPGAIAEDFDWWDLQYTALDDQLICPICRTAFVEPQSTDCGHTFCAECLKESWRSNSVEELVCPIDRCKLSAKPQPAPFVIRSLLDDLEVLCPYSERGCAFKGKRWLLESHVAADCEYVKVFCHAPCAEPVERRHFDAQACRCAATPEAEEAALDAESSGEEAAEPDALSVLCAGDKFGCMYVGATHEEVAAHAETCVHAKIAAAFEAQNGRMAALETENRALKRQVDVFQNVVRKNATELDQHILQEYERILRELRESGATIVAQQSAIAGLAAENTRVSADLSFMKGTIDSLRRQIFLLTQSQRRASFFSFQNVAMEGDAHEAAGDEQSRKRSQQKL